MSDLKIKCGLGTPFKIGRAYDCVYLTWPGDRHTPVRNDKIAGTITARPGELGVIVERRH